MEITGGFTSVRIERSFFSNSFQMRTTLLSQSTHISAVQPSAVFSANWKFCVWFVINCLLYVLLPLLLHAVCGMWTLDTLVWVYVLWKYVSTSFYVRPCLSSSRWFSNCLKWMWTINKFPRTFTYMLLLLMLLPVWMWRAIQRMHGRRDELIRFVLLCAQTPQKKLFTHLANRVRKWYANHCRCWRKTIGIFPVTHCENRSPFDRTTQFAQHMCTSLFCTHTP